MKQTHPKLYTIFLKTAGKTDQLLQLFDGTITAENYSWYIQSELIPRIDKLEAEGRLVYHKSDVFPLGE